MAAEDLAVTPAVSDSCYSSSLPCQASTSAHAPNPRRRTVGVLLDPVDRDRDDQDRAGDDLLPEARDGGDREPVLQRADEEHADGRAGDAADAAEEARAAEQHRGGRVERRRLADERARRAQAAAWITPAMPAQSPAIAYTRISVRATLIPERRAAVMLPPTA